jgi:hypothetical protein
MVACDRTKLSYFLGLDGGGSWFQMVGISTYITEVVAIQKFKWHTTLQDAHCEGFVKIHTYIDMPRSLKWAIRLIVYSHRMLVAIQIKVHEAFSHDTLLNQTRGVSHCGLAIYIKNLSSSK